MKKEIIQKLIILFKVERAWTLFCLKNDLVALAVAITDLLIGNSCLQEKGFCINFTLLRNDKKKTNKTQILLKINMCARV